MSSKNNLVSLIKEKTNDLSLPEISRVYFPDVEIKPDKDAEFGLIELADGSAGFFYAWLGDRQDDPASLYSEKDFIGRNPIELAEHYQYDDIARCSIGLGAINAISQHVFKSHSFVLPEPENSLGSLILNEDDHVGMVGYFPPLVKAISKLSTRLTVIEKKEIIPDADYRLELSLDPASLRQCNKILITASTMLNNTIDEILSYSAHAEYTVLIGPSAGFLPDVLFEKGVNAVGGSTVLDTDQAFERLKKRDRVGDAARKYIITKDHYCL
ncbi:MAG: hypothetical protein HND53_10585 [Proteobacteria bacterium]|nr:hypothetical protein [Pseudomonadota bacterium]NOG60938.1 hypothetical protein [Pseudomonadota bacterium]